MIHYSIFQIFRLKLKAKIRNLRRNPGNIDLESIQSDQHNLSTLFLQLKQAQHVAGVEEPNALTVSISDTIDTWDDLVFDTVASSAETIGPNLAETPPYMDEVTNTNKNIGPVPIEDQMVALPSNGCTSPRHRNLEIKHCVSVANEQLNHIWNLIAEKSFQFSHVIRHISTLLSKDIYVFGQLSGKVSVEIFMEFISFLMIS